MTESTAELLNAALQLPPELRLMFADALWSSVDEIPLDLQADVGLRELLRQRCEELDSGQVDELSLEEVMAELDEALERCASRSTRPSNGN